LDKFLILPVFGIVTDESAIQRAQEIFNQKTIIPVKSNQPAKDNGIINCLTWNIKR
jgi:agmatine deiminase